jgi:hypothetical protein
MKNNEFDFDVIARGSFLDHDTGSLDSSGRQKVYSIEAITIRLNHIALNDWLLSEILNVRECYVAGPEGDRKWEEHKAEYKARRDAWKKAVVNKLGLDTDAGSVCITQALSEVFTVVYIVCHDASQ